MSKRHIDPNLIGICNYHRIALISLVILLVAFQNAHPQQQIAQDAYAIFEQSCLVCHGPQGAYKETLLIEHNALIENGTVVPGNPNDSELYKRLITADTAKRMPLGSQLSTQAINTIRNWILAGAPDWAVTTTPTGDFISHGEILNKIETHLMSLSSFDRSFARYFTMTHLYNAGVSAQILQEYRKALYKLVNSLSWGVEVINPKSIDSQGTIFYIDLRHYEWDVNDGWGQIEAVYPYHISFDAPAQATLQQQLGRLQTETNSSVPSVHVDWFLATASLPPLYHNLLSLPLTDRALEARLEVDVRRNISNAPGVRVWRAGTNHSGVSQSNRVLERHTSRYGAYWKSYDFAGNVGTQNPFLHPLDFTPDGGEVIFNLPNGLQGYYIVDATGSRLDAAPISIVADPAASDPTVRTGLSCFGCHIEGMNTFEDGVRAVIESNTNPTYDKAQALRLYVEKSEMDALVNEDIETYRAALEETGGTFDDIEPISRFYEAFQGDVDAGYAAAVVGLDTEVFLEKIRENVGLQNAGLLVLDTANGTMKRDTWTSTFPDILFALDFPDRVKPPVVTEPDRLPGTIVNIPDTNLRAAIAEALGKSPNAPIIVEDMEKLGTHFKAENKGIRDLTGLQFATNAIELDLDDNPISDLSPLLGLTNLRDLDFAHTLVSDLSILAGLVNIEALWFNSTDISDLSPLTGLTNLKLIHAGNISASDLSPLTGLTKLEHLYLPSGNISDLTPLEGLINLEELYLHHNNISDLSPIAGLTKLRWLIIHDNNISDISPIAGLANLTRLNLSNNEISNFSPLDRIRENINTLFWYENPGFPKEGPKIEGPWLWVVLPDAELDESTDLLSEVTEGTVTETDIATHGAVQGSRVGADVWTARRLPPTGSWNIQDMLGRAVPDGIIYGTVSLYSPREQETIIYVGSDDRIKVWLNGGLIYESLRHHGANDYTDFLSVTLQAGKNVLLVAVGTRNGFFGFEPGTEYIVSMGVGYTLSPAPIHLGDTFTLDIHAENISDLSGWQFDIAFDPTALEAVDVSEGDFLKMDGGSTFFHGGTIDNAAGKIGGLSAARFSAQGGSGTGTLVQVRFKAKSPGETEVTLDNLQFGSSTGGSIAASPPPIFITIEERLTPGDVNRDGVVSILDLILVAQQLGNRVPADSPVDINGDGVVNVFDLVPIAQGIAGASAAPIGAESVDAAMIEAWIAQARLADDGSLAFKQGIANLEKLLASLIPEKTALLANYPNPFNPETWIPYQLAESGEVTLTIYDMNGAVVRRLGVGHRTAGMYRSRSRAAYWDGRNQFGEPLASGLYFYTLTAGEFSATRRMLILK